ncbi:MAG: Gldg family protein [Ignavibacteriales bacterium]|nr:Gldg family protein [Ignavibacteriales bacterium]
MRPHRTQTLLRFLIIAGILVLVNFISVRLFGRLDLTAQGVYTLSDASKKLVGSLDDRVTVKAYFTEDLPAPYNSNRRVTLDLLNEYKAYSGGNLTFEFLNPEGEKGEQEAQQQGVAPVQVQVIKEDRLEVKRGFMGLVMLYEDKKEAIPVVQNLRSLEYDVSSTLKRLTAKAKKKIGYTTGHQEAEPASFRQAMQAVSAQYDLVPVDLSSNQPVSGDIAALLVIAPQRKFADSATYQLDQYLMHGGSIAFLLNRYDANLQARFAQEIQTGLDNLLANYGVRVNADLVRDAQCAPVTVMQQQGFFRVQSQIPFPLLPNASNFNPENVLVKDLENVFFYFVSSVDTTLAAEKGLKADVLIRSSKQSGRQTGFMLIDPFQKLTPADLPEQHIPLAVAVEGSFQSFYADKLPRAETSASPPTKILLFGDGDFMKDEMLGSRDNLNLFANIVDYLADDEGLITIRSKDVTQPPLEQVTDGTRRLLKYANVALPPLLVVTYGLFRWRRRRAFKRALESQA